jgi:hypothetical protein
MDHLQRLCTYVFFAPHWTIVDHLPFSNLSSLSFPEKNMDHLTL